jgi:restriction endonuclease S subunit
MPTEADTCLASINQRQLKAFGVFDPPLEEQRRIVAYLDGPQAKVDALKQLQAQARFASTHCCRVLDKTFKGEL